MTMEVDDEKTWLEAILHAGPRLWHFVVRVVKHFLDNRGILLAGGVAYNTLLSVVPLMAVIILGLSNFYDSQRLISIIRAELGLIIPGQADEIAQAVQTVLDSRSLVGGVGILVLLFFSSLAFRMLEEAIASIFKVPDHVEGRSFWVSALIPYIYMVLFAVGIIFLTATNTMLEALAGHNMSFFGWTLSMAEAPRIGLYVLGLAGLSLLFTSIYKVLPVIEIQFSRALVGGVTAAVLWEIVRRILGWYFQSISLVGIIYGSLATVIIVLLGMEVAAIIILLGAQVIAELEMAADAKVPWYEDPRDTLVGEPFAIRGDTKNNERQEEREKPPDG
ncbi:MAG: YihY/virulence factor BrkB family protein [Myxococcota bacterium]